MPVVSRLGSAGRPVEVAISPDERFCLVSNGGAHNVRRFDLTTGELVATYEGGLHNPAQITISSGGTFCLIANAGCGRISKLDLRSGAIMQHFDGLDGVVGVTLVPSDTFALAHCCAPVARDRSSPSAIARIDLNTRRVSWPYPGAKLCGHSLSVSKCGSFALCGDIIGNRVQKLDLHSGLLVEEYHVRLAYGICVAPTLDFALFGTTGTAVGLIDLSTGAVEPNAYPRDAAGAPFEGALGVAIAPSSRFALVANTRGDSVTMIDLRPPEER